MSEQTRKFKDFTSVTSVQSSDYIVLMNSSGKAEKVSLATLKSALGVVTYDTVIDGVFIATHRTSDNYPVLYRPVDWPAQQSAGQVATGVLVCDGDKQLLIAPTESANKLYWGSVSGEGGGFKAGDYLTAKTDYAGKANTAKILASNSYKNDGDTYAPGFCNAYSRMNANNQGLPAGSWWLPSLGELWLMLANFNKINYALSKITGATLLQRDAYWSSTEGSAGYAWSLNLGFGGQGNGSKTSAQARVRPVSAFQKALTL